MVVGSRRTDEQRSVTNSSVPVDVLTAEALTAQPRGGLVDNVNLQPISDAATVVRPVNLRNLAPDHILVLVNGKRRHRGAVIAWLGNGIADGSQGPDMSTIPAIAVRQAELLRDGAAAQYGSDAIASVINFELKDAREAGSFELRSGLHQDRNAGDRSTCGANQPGSLPSSCNGIGDRAGAYSFAGNIGLPIGNAGFANIGTEFPDINIERLAHRMRTLTGHDINPDRVRERHRRSLENLQRDAAAFDQLVVLDNSTHHEDRRPRPTTQCTLQNGRIQGNGQSSTTWCRGSLEKPPRTG